MILMDLWNTEARKFLAQPASSTPPGASSTNKSPASTPVHDRAIALLLADLTEADFRHPETGHRFIYQLV